MPQPHPPPLKPPPLCKALILVQLHHLQQQESQRHHPFVMEKSHPRNVFTSKNPASSPTARNSNLCSAKPLSLLSSFSSLSSSLSLSLPSIKERDLVSRGRSSLSHLDSIWHQIYAFTQTSVPLFRDILGHLVLQDAHLAVHEEIKWPFDEQFCSLC